MSYSFYAAGIAIGIGLAAARGWDLLWLGVAGALLSFFYTAPPLKLVHRGLGDRRRARLRADHGPWRVLRAGAGV